MNAILLGSIFLFILAVFLIIRHLVNRLAYQNKLLTALRKLDVMAFSTTEIDKTCQYIVDAIRRDLGYLFGAIALVDDLAGGLRRIAISQAPSINTVLSELRIPYKKQVVFLNEKDNLLVKAMDEKKSLYTESLYDIQIGVHQKETADYIQKTLNIKGFFIYPLIAKNSVIGVIYYCTTIPKEKFSKFEFDIMDSFSRESARVLENVLLYQSLKLTSQKLVFANQKLKNIDQLKDDFVSLVSHELRTPLTAIRSYAWMGLHRPGTTLTTQLEKYIVRILISSERLINLVNDMLNISRIESGRINVVPESVDLISLCKDIIDEVYYSKSTSKNIQFILLQQALPKVFADPEKLRQVLMNIIGNAMKFSPAHGNITVSFFTDGKIVETSVKDEGPGISIEDLSKLFTKFGRLDNSYTATATTGGTGLGLYISKSLIELMHGKIWAASEGLGKGAVFTFSLPASTEEVLKNADWYTIKAADGQGKGLEPVAI